MSLVIVAEFDTQDTARAAVARLESEGVARDRIDSYPSLNVNQVKEPAPGEKVAGAETPLSTNGPLGHLQAIVAKVFGVGNPDENAMSESEPTHELTGKKPVFLSIHMEGEIARVAAVETMLSEAGASRVAQHDM